jgi:hypothetical protein
MPWFKRTKKGIQTPTEEKKDVPKGLWYKSPTGKVVDSEELEKKLLRKSRRWLPRTYWQQRVF